MRGLTHNPKSLTDDNAQSHRLNPNPTPQMSHEMEISREMVLLPR